MGFIFLCPRKTRATPRRRNRSSSCPSWRCNRPPHHWRKNRSSMVETGLIRSTWSSIPGRASNGGPSRNENAWGASVNFLEKGDPRWKNKARQAGFMKLPRSGSEVGGGTACRLWKIGREFAKVVNKPRKRWPQAKSASGCRCPASVSQSVDWPSIRELRNQVGLACPVKCADYEEGDLSNHSGRQESQFFPVASWTCVSQISASTR